MEFRYLAIEGPPGAGKTLLTERLGARLDANVVLDETENPFLADLHGGRPGSAFQAQLFFLLARHRQLLTLRQSDLFRQTTVANYLFDKDRIYAYLHLDDNELFIYQRLHDLLGPDIPPPDLVVYLQATTDVLRRRLRGRARVDPDRGAVDPRDVHEINEAYTHFFFHYTATPLLVVETSMADPEWGSDAVDDLIKQLAGMSGGTQYYVPRAR